MSIALSRSSIRYGAVALATAAALALAGCGSSSSSSHPVAHPATTRAATSRHVTATPTSLRSTSTATSSGHVTSSGNGFVAATPAGFRDATASAQGGPINILYLATGPRTGGLTTNINVVREPSGGTTDINAIVRAEVKGLRLMFPGNLEMSTPEPVTVDGEPARALDYLHGSATRMLHLRQVVVEHQGWIYVITYTASSNGYAASLPALAQTINSWRWV